MANEINITLSARIENGAFKDRIDSTGLAFDQATLGGHRPVVSVGTSEEDLTVGDVATLGWCYLRNLDATNYVTYGPKSSGSMVAMGRLEPGEIAIFRLDPSVTVRWVADTAACKVDVRIYED